MGISERPVTSSEDETGATPAGAGRRLRALVTGLVLLEALVLIGVAVILLVLAATSSRDSAASLVSIAVVTLIVGAGLAVCARGVRAGVSWSRGPVLTWQLLQAALGMPLVTMGSWWAGVPLLLVALTVGLLIVRPQVVGHAPGRY